ncbi:MAG: EAL domain-containing protein [Gammaproteobacteria bacterium]
MNKAQQTIEPHFDFAGIFHSEKTAWLVLAISLFITLLSGFVSKETIEARAQEHFDNEVYDAVKLIESRLVEYEQVLIGGVSLFQAFGPDAITRNRWKEYVDGLMIDRHFPGIQGIGFSRVVRPELLKTHENQIQAQGFPNYRIYPAGEREIYTSIIYLEPFDWRNQRAFGYDMYSEPNRREAMSRARDTGQASITRKVTLVQETDKDVQPGFLMYLPLYEINFPLATVKERRDALIGYVYSPFRMRDLMNGILKTERPTVDFVLYDGTTEYDKENLLYQSGDDKNIIRSDAVFNKKLVINLAGHAWTSDFFSTTELEKNFNFELPYYVIAVGTVVDILLFLIIWSLAAQKKKVRVAVDEATNELIRKTNTLELAKSSVQMGVWEYDYKTKRIHWDQRMYELYDLTPGIDKINFSLWKNCVHPDDRIAVINAVKQTKIKGKSFNNVFRIISRKGKVRYIEAHGMFTFDENNQAVKLTGVNSDVTHKHIINESLILAANVYEHVQEALIITDNSHRIIDVNTAFVSLTNFNKQELLGMTPLQLCPGNDHALSRKIGQSLDREEEWTDELKLGLKKGEPLDVLMTISHVPDQNGMTQNYIYSFSNISEIKSQQRQLERAAHYDSLTGLPNRVLMLDRLHQAMADADRNENNLAVCFFDMDGFKKINDTYGHAVGDELLIKIGERLHTVLRETDSASRFGGDEFVVLFAGIKDLADCHNAVRRLMKVLSQPYYMSNGSIFNLTLSLGVTIYPEDKVDADVLLRHADQTMYMSKKSGRNCFHFFDPDQERISERQSELLNSAEAALVANQFLLHFQPQLDMVTGSVVGMEALIRWQHPHRGLLPPSEFLPVIEKNELATAFDRWVVDAVFRQQRDWKLAGYDVPISINVMAYNLQNNAIDKILEEALEKYPEVDSTRIQIEITENMALNYIERVKQVVKRCQQLGFSIALDDFGTGYSSLSHLKKLKVNVVKIDRSFVSEVHENTEDQMFIKGIIDLAHAFNCKIIAEGVEGVAEGMKLIELGCTIAQGYGIAKPMHERQLMEWVKTYRAPHEWMGNNFRQGTV